MRQLRDAVAAHVLPALADQGFTPDQRLDAHAGWSGSSHTWFLHHPDRNIWVMLDTNDTRDPAIRLRQVDQAPDQANPFSAFHSARTRLFLKLWPQPALLEPAFGVGVTRWADAPRVLRIAIWLLTLPLLPLQLVLTMAALLIAPPTLPPRRTASATRLAERAARRLPLL